jgi:asparagine synthase (glutamine-hydrolysing)
MSGAIFGVSGTFTANDMRAMDDRLRHRGELGGYAAVGPEILLGWRADSTRAPPHPLDSVPLDSVPLVCACSNLNRAELLFSLERTGDEPITDAELLWELYRMHGPEAFEKIHGQFAVALLDPSSGELILAVDAWAARPLAFADCDRGYAFATDCKALLALPDVEPDVNRRAVAHLQASKYLPVGEGLFTHIHPLSPGTWVRLGRDGARAARYAPVRLHVARDRPKARHADDLRETLLAACSRMVRGLDSIAVALSGGLDSTFTVGAIRAVAPRLPIQTFTVSFQENDPTLRLAAETAEHFKTFHEQIIVPVDDLPQWLPELVWTMEEPVGREEMLVYLVLVKAAAARGLPFVAHGHLSDMLFAGMPRHVVVRAAARTPALRKPLLDLYNYSQSGAGPETLLGAALVRACYRGKRTAPPRVFGVDELGAFERLNLASREPLNALLLESLRHPTEIGALERLHARHGLAYGSIFHDLDVANCAFTIPDDLKIRGTTRKHILRRACSGILPPALASRPKDLIRIPRNDRLKSVLRGMARDLLNEDGIARRGMFDPEEIARILGAGDSFPDDRFYHVWTLLLTELWMLMFADGRGAALDGQRLSQRRIAANDPSYDAARSIPPASVIGK